MTQFDGCKQFNHLTSKFIIDNNYFLEDFHQFINFISS